MKRSTIAIVGAVAVGVVGAAALGIGRPAASTVTYRTVPATVADVEQTAAATGSLTAAARYDLAFGERPVEAAPSTPTASGATAGTDAVASGAGSGGQVQATTTWPVTEVRVQVGQVVSAGDVLAIADDASAAFAVEIAEQNVAGATKDLRNAEAGGSASSKASARTQVTQARAQLRQARTSRGDTAAQNANAVRTAEQTLADAREAYADDKDAGAADPVVEQDLAAIDQARRSLAATRIQARGSNNQASAQVTNAQLSLAAANRAYNTATAKPSALTLATLLVAVDDAEQALADAQEALDAATIRAPIDGRVTAVYAVVGAESTGTAATLESLELEVRVAVDESDIASVAAGQAATVSITPLGETASGTVRTIDPVAITGTNAVTRYTVTVALDGATASSAGDASDLAAGNLLPGMSAEITVVTARAADVLTVPAAALSGTTGAYTVRVLASDAAVETRTVEVGLLTSELAQVTSGLAEGDAVITGTSADLLDTGGGGFGQPQGGGQGGFGGQQP